MVTISTTKWTKVVPASTGATRLLIRNITAAGDCYLSLSDTKLDTDIFDGYWKLIGIDDLELKAGKANSEVWAIASVAAVDLRWFRE